MSRTWMDEDILNDFEIVEWGCRINGCVCDEALSSMDWVLRAREMIGEVRGESGRFLRER
jgi:hypothetical protein